MLYSEIIPQSIKMRKRLFLYFLCSLLIVFQPAYSINPVKIDTVKAVPEYQLQEGKATCISLTYNDNGLMCSNRCVLILPSPMRLTTQVQDCLVSSLDPIGTPKLKMELHCMSQKLSPVEKGNELVCRSYTGGRFVLEYVPRSSASVQSDFGKVDIGGGLPNSTCYKVTLNIVASEIPLQSSYPPICAPSATGYGRLGLPQGRNSIGTFSPSDSRGTEGLRDFAFYDGFGRIEEHVKKDFAELGEDVVDFQEYDEWGRAGRSWLPASLPGTATSYVSLEEFKEGLGYRMSDEPYSYKIYESSPENKVLHSYGPGADWHKNRKSVFTSYFTNVSDNDSLGILTLSVSVSNHGVKATVRGEVPTGTYSVIRTEDEDGRVQFDFFDMYDRLVLSRRVTHDGKRMEKYDTYFVYRNQDKLAAIFPPAASDEFRANQSMDADLLARYAYLYEYDVKGRLIAKKLPGCDWTSMCYDKADRLVLVQDGVARRKNNCHFTIYDIFGRECLKGSCSFWSELPKNIDDYVVCKYTGNSPDCYGYVVSGLSVSPAGIRSADYYDHYYFLQDGLFPSSSSYQYVSAKGYAEKSSVAKSFHTGQVRCELVDDGIMYETLYYDHQGRLCQSHSNTHLGTYEHRYYSYNFLGQPLSVRTSFDSGRNYVHTFSYDHVGRKLSDDLSFDDAPPINLMRYGYDDLGRMYAKYRMNGALVSKWAYNVRSWIDFISGDLLEETIRYNEASPGCRSYSGNVGEVTYSFPQTNSSHSYHFGYDGLSRLVEANSDGKEDYSTNYVYDKMGNVNYVRRYGLDDDGLHSIIDEMKLRYDGNHLIHASNYVEGPFYKDAFHFVDGVDETTEYCYDENGNMTKDRNKGIDSIYYNFMNQPMSIRFKQEEDEVSVSPRRIFYNYDSDGNKLSAIYSGNLRLDYVGDRIYENGRLAKLLFDGGYCTFDNDTIQCHFYFLDHLGNNCVVSDEKGRLEQVNCYYPYGGLMGKCKGDDVQRYKYNGKELDRMHGLNWYDYGARMYDAVLTRWVSMDPLCAKYPWTTPYGYCNLNPMSKVDLDGRDEWDINQNGEVVGYRKDDSHDAFYIVSMNDLGEYERGSSVEFSYHTVLSTLDVDFKDENYFILRVKGDENSTKLFEFFADNTSVEWSHMKFCQQGKEVAVNTISTSHGNDNDTSYGYILKHISQYGYLRSYIHNHPSNIAVPSGLGPNSLGGDILALHNIVYYSTLNGSLYPSSFIYTSKDKRYTRYSLQSKREDFGYIEIELPDVIAKP